MFKIRQRKLHKNLLLLFLLTFLFFVFYNKIKAEKPDKIDTLIIMQNLDSARYYCNINQKKAKLYIENVRTLSLKAHHIKGIAYYFRIKGLIDYYEVNYSAALDNSLNALKIFQTINDKKGEGAVCNFIGLIYSDQKYYKTAREYYNLGLQIRLSINDTNGIAASYNNIGVFYKDINKPDSALFYYQKSLQIIQQTNDVESQSMYLENIGRIYIDDNKPDSAILYFNKSLEIRLKYNDLQGLANIYTSIGNYYLLKKNCKSAIVSYKKGLYYSEMIGIKYEIESALAGLSKAYALCGNYLEAYYSQVRYKNIYDSARRDEVSKRINQIELEKGFEKERELSKLLQEKSEMEHKSKLKSQQTFRNYILIALFGTIILAFIIWQSYKRKKKDNIILNTQKKEILKYLSDIKQQNEEIKAQSDEIEAQNFNLSEAYSIIEKKNKNITDSIKYAQRIQSAILPPFELIASLIPDSFILYKPKAIVSGDFYWLDWHDHYIYIAAVDCTGHGVPGALMSIVGYNLLNQALNEMKLNETSEIVDYLSNNVAKTLRQSEQENSMRDGMDIVLCRIDKLSKKMQITAVLNPLYVIRDGELSEFKGEKWSIGKSFTEVFSGYGKQEIDLQTNDTIYLFSDGFNDQFSANSGKKFTSKKFKQKLIEIAPLPMPDQKIALEREFNNWKGNSEQIDDVMVIGIRIS